MLSGKPEKMSGKDRELCHLWQRQPASHLASPLPLWKKDKLKPKLVADESVTVPLP